MILKFKSAMFKLSLASQGIGAVVWRWQYLLLAAFYSLLFMQIIFWFLNIGLAQYLLFTAQLGLGEKIQFILDTTTSLLANANTLQGFLLVAISLIQGLALAIVTFLLRQKTDVEKRTIGGTGLASLGAVVGLGCAACGTSLVMPIIAIFFSGSVYAVADTVGVFASFVALIIGLYALYRLGHNAYPLATVK